jgi:hypothetical protein
MNKKFILVSFPKSGRTWVRVMLDKTKAKGLYKFTHDKLVHNLPMLYLTRCPLDTVVSYYHQRVHRKYDVTAKEQTIDEFCIDWIDKIIKHHFFFLENKEKNTMVIKYEDLIADAHNVICEVLKHYDIPTQGLKEAIEHGSYDNMKNLHLDPINSKGYSLKHKTSENPNAMKVRKGRVGTHREELQHETIRQLKAILNDCDYYKRISISNK